MILKAFSLEVSREETVFFSCGLSVALLMFIGLAINEICPLIGIIRPLSAFPIIVVEFVVTLVLYLFARHKRTDFSWLTTKNVKPNASFLVIGFIFVIIIVGTVFGSVYHNNTVLLFLAITISALILFSFSRKLIPSKFHLLLVFVISFFLLFGVSLISQYLIGYDINLEMSFARLTYSASFWDRSVPFIYNSMLSVTILPVMYSIFLGIDLNLVFKVVYPLIYLFVPLILYIAYRKVSGPRVALFSVFLFMSFDAFSQMVGLARQMIAELFFALLILVVVQESIRFSKRRLLLVVFGASLIVSHYGLTLILIFYFILTFCILYFFSNSTLKITRLINGKLVLLLISLSFFWYILVTPTVFGDFTNAANNIVHSVFEGVSGPGVTGLVPSYISPLHLVSRYLFYAMQGLILVGLFVLVATRKKLKFNAEYFSLSVTSAIILFLAILVPFFAATLNITRFYHITLFFLAPLSAIGCLTIYRLFTGGKLSFLHILTRHRVFVKMVGAFIFSFTLIFFFLFQIGFIYEVSGDVPTSLPLSLNRLLANPLINLDLYQTYNPEQNVFSAQWLEGRAINNVSVYADSYSEIQVLASYGNLPLAFSENPKAYYYTHLLLENSSKLESGAIIYLSQFNILYGKIENENGSFWALNTSTYLDSYNKVYSNGGSDIYVNP